MTCDCPIATPIPCTVVDCFGGSGTTALVARELGRRAVLVELSAEYIELARERLGMAQVEAWEVGAPKAAAPNWADTPLFASVGGGDAK